MEQVQTVIESLTSCPTASGLATRLAARHLERKGINPEPFLAKAGISPRSVVEGGRINAKSQTLFLDLVSRAAGDEFLGLTLAGECDLRETGMLYYVAASSPDLGDALYRISRYARLGNEALVLRLQQKQNWSVELSYSGLPRHQDRHQMELFAYSCLRLCRRLVGRNFSPVSVKFIHHRSGDTGQIRRLFGCDIEFDADVDEISFDIRMMELPLVAADPYLNQLMMKMCDETMAVRSTNISPFRTIVENTIAPLLPHAEATTRTVAKRLGLSERTFARRLATEGLSFGEILDQQRRDLALRYLGEDLQASQIAWLLGFHQPSSFSHACRRWIGKSPSEFRRAREASPALELTK